MTEWQKVKKDIDELTDNEDYRQELWTAYLSGEKHLSFQLEIIKLKQQEIDQFRHSLHYLIANPPHSGLQQVLDSFNGIERTVLYLLIIGYNIEDISKYSDICIIRVRHIVDIIKQSNRWNKWLLKSTSMKTKDWA